MTDPTFITTDSSYPFGKFVIPSGSFSSDGDTFVFRFMATHAIMSSADVNIEAYDGTSTDGFVIATIRPDYGHFIIEGSIKRIASNSYRLTAFVPMIFTDGASTINDATYYNKNITLDMNSASELRLTTDATFNLEYFQDCDGVAWKTNTVRDP
jgi:hypothetical protein